MNYLNKLIDLICFVFGAFLLIISIFSFNHDSLGLIGERSIPFVYYPFKARVGIGIGAALICLGFLKRSWEKK